jgi:actin related protein 2/3 complex subunit 4
VRRVPLPDFSVTFLLTNFHLERYQREGLIDFICSFVEDLHAEVSAMKLGLRSRGRAVVQQYWQQLERRHAGAAACGPAGAKAAAATGGGAA